MKKIIPGFIAFVLALGFSAFTTKMDSKFTTYYFKNTGTKAAPHWVYYGTSAPNCITNPANYCYGSTSVPPNADGTPAAPIGGKVDGTFAF